MKLLLAVAALVGVAVSSDLQEDCSWTLELKCATDINNAYKLCEKAAEEKGKDIPADLECMKYLTEVEKDCWPCICYVAEKKEWKVKGCSSKLTQ